jgi:pyrimidine oxygenase
MPLELGVFLPVGNNGWIISKTSPQYMPTFALNKQITILAEELGFDYVFSMCKWRGFFGETRFWNTTVESMTLMGGLAAYTREMKLIASISPIIVHPAVFAKMAATLDDICEGRLALNIVSAANRDEYAQMGLYPENFESFRYEYTAEWLHVVKRLWTEESVTFHGQYFDLEDCHSDPKPIQKPYPPIVCATSSERGFQFVAEECDYAFLAANTTARFNEASLKAKAIARSYGREVKTQAHLILVLGETEAEAQAMFQSYRAGADLEAIGNTYHLRARDAQGDRATMLAERFQSPGNIFYSAVWHVGGPESTAEFLTDLAVNGQTDGLVFIFHDFLAGMQTFHDKVMPIMRRHGITFGRAG